MVVLKDKANVGHRDVPKQGTTRFDNSHTGDAVLAHTFEGLQHGGRSGDVDDEALAKPEVSQLLVKNRTNLHFLPKLKGNIIYIDVCYLGQEEAANVTLGDDSLDTARVIDNVDSMNSIGLPKDLSNLQQT